MHGYDNLEEFLEKKVFDRPDKTFSEIYEEYKTKYDIAGLEEKAFAKPEKNFEENYKSQYTELGLDTKKTEITWRVRVDPLKS